MANKLQEYFYLGEEVMSLSKALLGTRIVTRFDKKKTVGMIVETEAYVGSTDKASHAYGGRRTARTEIMFARGGVAYVYLCYGIHHLFNIVVGPEGIPHAILIRAVEPVEGIPYMLKRCNKKKVSPLLTNGPGKLSKALGITVNQNGMSLVKKGPIWITEREKPLLEENIQASPRIGVDFAEEDAQLPYRFTIKGNPYVSK